MRATLLAILAALAVTRAVAAPAAQPAPAPVPAPPSKPEMEIRFCPSAQVRSYPLDADGRQQSLLLQAFTVTNRGDVPLRIEEIVIALLQDGRVVDSRTLDETDIDRWVGNGPP